MTDDHPFDVFKHPLPSYKYQIRPKGTRVLSAPEPRDADERERALVNFQPTAKRALRIADEHDLRITVHRRMSRSGAKLIDRIDAARQS
jgi:hypothetical protein